MPIGELLSLGSAIIWGFSVSLFKIIGNTISPYILNPLKNTIGTILFIITCIAIGNNPLVYELNTNVYNIFYQLPIPIINIVLGIGTGSENYKCTDIFDGGGGTVVSCEDYWEKGSLTQWYTSIGMPIIPFFDIHLSYRSITSKNVKVKNNIAGSEGDKANNSRSVTGLGIAFNF